MTEALYNLFTLVSGNGETRPCSDVCILLEQTSFTKQTIAQMCLCSFASTRSGPRHRGTPAAHACSPRPAWALQPDPRSPRSLWAGPVCSLIWQRAHRHGRVTSGARLNRQNGELLRAALGRLLRARARAGDRSGGTLPRGSAARRRLFPAPAPAPRPPGSHKRRKGRWTFASDSVSTLPSRCEVPP